MIALDIEVIPNESMVDMLPEPEVAIGNLRDPLKIQAKIEEVKKKQKEKLGLDPITGRICSFAIYGDNEDERFYKFIPDTSESSEIALVTDLLEVLKIGNKEKPLHIITWNGIAFDFPYIYKRAALLNIVLPDNVPGMSYWTKKYINTPHCDLMQWWNNWGHSSGNAKLDYIGRVFLGAGKTERDYNTYLDLIKKGEGEKIGVDNLCDVEITYKLYKKLENYFF